MRTASRALTAAALLTALPLALSACGDDSSDSASSPSASSAASGATSASSSDSSSGSGAVTPVVPTDKAHEAIAPVCPPAGGTPEQHQEFTAAPPMCLTPGAKYSATFSTDAGDFTADLDAEAAPKTVNNFVFLARNHYYDGISFHRVIPGFVIQGGDPQGTGAGGPGYEFADELPEQGKYREGSLAMANAGANTNGSQFFVITGEQGTSLPPKYSLFGQVTKGMDVVEKIEGDGSASGTPSTEHIMKTVTITQR